MEKRNFRDNLTLKGFYEDPHESRFEFTYIAPQLNWLLGFNTFFLFIASLVLWILVLHVMSHRISLDYLDDFTVLISEQLPQQFSSRNAVSSYLL